MEMVVGGIYEETELESAGVGGFRRRLERKAKEEIYIIRNRGLGLEGTGECWSLRL